MIVPIRADVVIKRREIFSVGVATLRMVQEKVAGRGWNGPVQGQNIFDDRRVSSAVIAKTENPIGDAGKVGIKPNLGSHLKMGSRVRIGVALDLAVLTRDRFLLELPRSQQLRGVLAAILEREGN